MKDLTILENNQFFHGYSYTIFYFKELETFPLHWHNYVEIIYTLQSGLIYEVNGEKIYMEKGDVLFIWPGELHSIIYQPKPNNTLMLQFDSQLLTDRIDFQKSAYLFFRTRILREKENNVILTKVQKILLDILNTSLYEEHFQEMKSCILIYEMIIFLGEGLRNQLLGHKKTFSLHKSKVEQQMLLVCNHITSHCTEHISLEAAASVAGFSKYHFSKLFKKYTGHSFPDFQAKERIRIAETLLMDPSLSITEVSMESGFNSMATFNRAFLKFKKVTPTEFRRMYLLSDSDNDSDTLA
ncbi:MAG TPA: AraC family transcriptional regulator [Ruminiclostridium sp.]|nr:AraC family transcriptional regulator [Ruminiclostridium sp.]